MASPRSPVARLAHVVMTLALLTAVVRSGGASSPQAAAAGTTSGAEARFAISGSVTRLFPGAGRPMNLVLINRNAFPIVVTSLAVARIDPDPLRPRCAPKQALRTTTWTGRKVVPGGDRVTVRGAITVSMEEAAPNPCQGATFGLTFSGQGTRR